MTTQGVGWASEEASDLVAPPSNLVLELILASGTPKNFILLLKSRLSTKASYRSMGTTGDPVGQRDVPVNHFTG